MPVRNRPADVPVSSPVKRQPKNLYWAVEDCCWRTFAPELAADAAAHLAPPVVVSAAPRTD